MNASIGVVFVRLAPTPLDIRAIVVGLPRDGARIEALALLGMRSAGFGELKLENTRVFPEEVLGSHLPASRRGLWGMTRAFLRMRLQVASMALGAGSALLELASHGNRLGPVESELRLEGASLARLVWVCAGQAEGELHGAETRAALRKVARVEWATRVEVRIGSVAAADDSSPLVFKFVRDIMGLEFMAGVGPKQRQILAADWLRSTLGSARAGPR